MIVPSYMKRTELDFPIPRRARTNLYTIGYGLYRMIAFELLGVDTKVVRLGEPGEITPVSLTYGVILR